MKILYLDCSAGISGDMTVGTLIDLGVPLEHLKEQLTCLNISSTSYSISAKKILKYGIAATGFMVEPSDHQTHRHYSDIVSLIDSSSLTNKIKDLSQKIFCKLAEAEAKVHGVEIGKVHFHEVGAIDSIIDIVGTAIGLDYLGIDRLFSSPLPFGSGWVETAHGRLPVPAPATAEIMRGLPIVSDPVPGEWVTPTGAAIIASLAVRCGSIPDMTIENIGYGAGSRDCSSRPNLIRGLLGIETTRNGKTFVIETHLDDMNPEALGFLMERLFEYGALDAAFSPLQMKKNRPATRLTVIAADDRLDPICKLVLTESSAIGVRYYPVERVCLEREVVETSTSFGKIRMKRVTLPDGSRRISPEYEECRRIAIERNLPLLQVYKTVEREVSV